MIAVSCNHKNPKMISARTIVALQNLPSSVAFIEIQNKETGDRSIGSCFHVGNGYFVTARHVIEPPWTILRVGRHDVSQRTFIGADGHATKTTTHADFDYTGQVKIVLHEDPKIDVAVLQLTEAIGPYPAAQLQPYSCLSKVADALSEGEFLSIEVYVLGFPPIPIATDATLVMIPGQVSAVIKSQYDGRRHFIVSGMARGGFSGGPVFLVGNPTWPSHVDNSGYVVGVVGQSVTKTKDTGAESPEELGFLAATSVESVWEILKSVGAAENLP